MFVKRETPSPGGSDRSREGVHCDLCGSSNPAVRCDKCNGHAFCLSCDDMYHRHPKRKQHLRKAIDSYALAATTAVIRPPSGQRINVPGDPSKMPIPPPRKKKGKTFFPAFGSEIPALPKKEFSITEKLGSIRRFMSNRPLPPIPKHEVPLQQGAIPPKPRAASPKSNNRQDPFNNKSRNQKQQRDNRSGSPEYQNILAHLTKVAQNSADEWEEEPSVSTSGSTRGSSVGDDIGWGQDVAPLSKSGAPPRLRNKPTEDLSNPAMEDWSGFGTMRRNQMQRGIAPQDGMQGRMTHSTSMGNLQTGFPNPSGLPSGGFFPGPYPPNYYPPGGVPGVPYPGVYPGYVGQFPRGSWSHLQPKGDLGDEGDVEEGQEEGEEEELANQGYGGGTLTKTSKSEMKRSQSVMYDPILAAQQGGFFPFGPLPHGYPGSGYFPPAYPPYWQPHPGAQRISTPPSPVISTRTLNRKTRGRSRKHQRDDESVSSDRSREDSSRRGSRSHRVRSESSGPEASSEEEHHQGGIVKNKDDRTNSGVSEDRSLNRGSDTAAKDDDSKDTKDEEFIVPEIEDKPPPPPPPIPTAQWECTFCTFINPPGGRVCGVCCKTISASPLRDTGKGSNDSKGTTSPEIEAGNKDELTELKEKKKKLKEEFLNFSPEFLKEQEQLEEEIRKRLERNRRLSEGFPGEPTSRRNSLTETTVKPPEEETSRERQATTSPTASLQIEPSPTYLSQSISAATSPSPTAAQRASPSAQRASPSAQRASPSAQRASPSAQRASPSAQRASPAAERDSPAAQRDSSPAQRTSPAAQRDLPIAQRDSPKPVNELGSVTDERLRGNDAQRLEDKIVKPQISTKTDSSCQTNVEESKFTQKPNFIGHSMSVGTDDISENILDDTPSGAPAKVEMGTSPPRLTKDLSSQNLFNRTGHFSNLERSVSQSELRDDLMFPGRQNAIERREDFNRGQLLRSLSRASLVSEPGMYAMQEQIIRAPESPFTQRKGLGADWRNRRSSDFSNRDYVSQQQQIQSGWYPRDRNIYPSMEDLLERRRQETMRAQGLEMIRLIRKAEQSGFIPDDLQVALNHCAPDQDPIDWLEENWTNMIETVVTLATNYGHDKPDNDVGIISAGEAKEALRIHRGNIWASVTECVESRQRKFLELRARGNFSRREVVAALTANQGNLELAYSELTRSTHTPFSLNIWGPGSGVENFDSARLSPNDERSAKGMFDRYNDQIEKPRTPYLEHRKQRLSDSTNIHRSMLNLNMIGLEDDFQPLNAGGAISPKLSRRFSFSASRSSDFAGFSPNFNLMNRNKTSHDASDEMSITSEDLESLDAPLKKTKERQPRESAGRGKRSKKSGSTSFLNKLASLRKPRTVTTDGKREFKTEPESDFSETEPRRKPLTKSFSVQQLNRTSKDEKPQRVSFLQRMMRGSSTTSDNKESGFVDYIKENNDRLRGIDLEHAAEVSSEEKVQAFLQKMPEQTVSRSDPQKKGFLQRLGLRSSKKEFSSSASDAGSAVASLGAGSDKETPKGRDIPEKLGSESVTASTSNLKDLELARERPSPKVDIQTARSRFFDDMASTSGFNVQIPMESDIKTVVDTSEDINKTRQIENKIEESVSKEANLELNRSTTDRRNETLNISTKNSEDIAIIPKIKTSESAASISNEVQESRQALPIAVESEADVKDDLTKVNVEITTKSKSEIDVKGNEKLNDFEEERKLSPTPTKPAISNAKIKNKDSLEVTKIEPKKRTPSPAKTLSPKSKATKTESNTDSDSATEKRVIRREVKEELVEEREKSKDDAKISGADSASKKPEIVQTKLEIVETIVEIVKPRDGKTKAGKVTKEDRLNDKKITKKDDKPSIGATTSESPKAAKDISYPVSRFAKPREPLFAFKDKSRTVTETEESTMKNIKQASASKTQEAPTTTPVTTEEETQDAYSNVPTSPTTGLPLKSILKKTPSFNETAPPNYSYETKESTIEKPLTLKENSGNRYAELSQEPIITQTDASNQAKSLNTASASLSPKLPSEDHSQKAEPTTPSTTILSVEITAETMKVPETMKSNSATGDAQTLSNENNNTPEEGKLVRRRRRMSDVEDIPQQQQAPPASNTSAFPRRRRSLSTERANAPVYRTRERKMDALVIDTFDVSDIDAAALEDEATLLLKTDLITTDDKTNESNEVKNATTIQEANDPTKFGVTSPRARRQRSVSRDRLSRTPSVTDSQEGIKGSTTDILRIAKPPAVTKQDSFRERRRSTSFDLMKGRFAEDNALAKAAKSLEEIEDSEVAVPPIKIGSQVEKYKQKAEEKKNKAVVIAKPVDRSSPAISSKRLVLDNKIKELIADGKCETYEQAETAARLLEMNFDEHEALDASKECGTLYQAISYLSQDCELCAGKFPVADMVSMVNCTHRACKECLKAYFTIQIRDRNIMELICPYCNEPDLTDDDIASEYFNHMDLLLKNIVEPEIHELFHRKLRDRVLMKDPLFRWCSQCSSGFIITNPNQKRLLCPDCKAVTCASCRKRWEKQHEGITCDQFLEWKEANDPEVQAAGLAQHLAENGIDCPNCHFRYALAKGGCMHFRCVQCQFDFCSGCGKPFKMGLKCGVSEFCIKLGLHAHHPRNCLFYLRDKEPAQLQKLLDEYNVSYNTEPPEGMNVKKVCQVMEQKETADGLKDDICGKDIDDGFAGLCRLHYIEFLVALINKNRVDPVPIMDVHDLQLVLQRGQKQVPEYEVRQSEEQYRQRLIEVIKEQLPLEKIEGTF